MDQVLNLGIRIIMLLQGLGGWLIMPMKFFSFLGNEEFFLLIMPVLYWCLDAAIGLRVGMVLLASDGLNGFLKMALRGPRPYFISAQVRALSSETSFGIPSGHAQNSAAVWVTLAAWTGRKWPAYRRVVWIAAVAIVFLIGLSRIYLAVHFPSDVLLGWIIGGLLAWAFLKFEQPVTRRLSQHSPAAQIAVVFALSLAIILASASVKIIFSAWTIPSLWSLNIRLAGSAVQLPQPFALSGVVSSSAAFFGLAAGFIGLKISGGFDTAGSFWKRAARYPLGLVGIFVIWYGLDLIFPGGELLLPLILRYLRYALVGLWISALAPLLFIRLGLAFPARPLPKVGLPKPAAEEA